MTSRPGPLVPFKWAGPIVAILLLALVGCGEATGATVTAATATVPLTPASSPVVMLLQVTNPAAAARAASASASVSHAIAAGAQVAPPVQPEIRSSPRPGAPSVPISGTPASIAEAGSLVPVRDGVRLWIACAGRGGPTVVMDAGINSGSAVWTLVQPGVSGFARTCVYDRAGLGRSDAIARPRTSREVVDDLHTLLLNAREPGPYVLVAHSFGGLNARLYADTFPRDVVGMVLVDPVHEDRFARNAAVLTPQQRREFEQGRQANPEGLDYYESSAQVRAIGRPLPNIPLVVIARGRGVIWPDGWPAPELERIWRELMVDLVSRAPRGRLVVAEKSDHNILRDEPEVIVTATRQVWEEARHP